MRAIESIVKYLEGLIQEGESLLSQKFQVKTSSFTVDDFVPIDPFHRWCGNCRVLDARLGRALEPWKDPIFVKGPNKVVIVMSLLGTIRSIKDAVEGGHLVSFADLVMAEAFSDLVDQAEYLFSKGYWLASGVLCRAVLEEDLRALAKNCDCLPDKDRPTLGDLNAALYKAVIYDKLEFKLIDTLAAIGNDCAHNNEGVTKERVRYLIDQLVALLPRLRT